MTTKLEVDIDKFNKNIENIQKYVGNKKIMPVIKASAYGTYLNKKIEVINKFDIVAVALVKEAIKLRELGYNKDILVLNQPYIDELEEIIKYNIIIGISSDSFLEEIKTLKRKLRVHIEIETGMNRTGVKQELLEDFFANTLKNKKIVVEGIYTHLSSADYDDDYTLKQLELFENSVRTAREKFSTIKYIHSSSSNGLINYNDNVSNMVRPGLIMYGYESFKEVGDKIELHPICKLKTKVTFMKEIDEGDSISYSRTYIAKKKMIVATIPIGYADGLKRELSNKGEVVINNQIAKIIGNICMDGCIIDVTDIKDVKVGTDVYIWDNKNITVTDIANKCNTINYEIISTISDRVERDFVKK